MMALTLLQPWAMAICYLGKRIENRTWLPSDRAIGKSLAIHAGKGWDEKGAEYIWDAFGVRYAHWDVPKGCVVAIARLDGFIKDGSPIAEDQRSWFFGPFGWKLSEVRVLEQPVFCRGKQGLWTLEDRLVAEHEEGGTRG